MYEEIEASFAKAMKSGDEEPEEGDIEMGGVSGAKISDEDYEAFMKYDDLKKWLDFMFVEKYCEFKIAEDYFRFFVGLQKYDTYPEYVTDSIRYDSNKKINDNSPTDEFSFFIDNNSQKNEENIFIYSVHNKVRLLLDNDEVEIVPNFNYMFKKPNKIKILLGHEYIQIEPVNLNKFQTIKNE